jgi:hypothetical protein
MRNITSVSYSAVFNVCYIALDGYFFVFVFKNVNDIIGLLSLLRERS